MSVLVKSKPVVAEVIEGLAEADAAADLLNRKYHDMRGRLDQANLDMKAGVARRNGLLERAKAGEVVLGEEVAEVEAAIRTAEGTAALMAEALPAVVKQIAEAEALVERLVRRPLVTARTDAERRYQAAEEALYAAKIEVSAAWQANENARLWVGDHVGPHQLSLHAPAALERKARLDKILQRDKDEAAAKQAEAQMRAAVDASITEIKPHQAYFESGRY